MYRKVKLIYSQFVVYGKTKKESLNRLQSDINDLYFFKLDSVKEIGESWKCF